MDQTLLTVSFPDDLHYSYRGKITFEECERHHFLIGPSAYQLADKVVIQDQATKVEKVIKDRGTKSSLVKE